MDKQFRKKFFIICLIGGLVFAIPFFFVFGSAIGYKWYWAVICLVGGLFFALAFYFAWTLMEKFQKPLSFENKKAQQKLLEYEVARNNPYEYKFSAFMNYGKGLKQEVCETVLYFEENKIHVAFCHFGKIYSFEISYESIDLAVIENNKILVINTQEFGSVVFSIKNFNEKLEDAFIFKGLPLELLKDEE